jgi:hypothetical protein
MISILLLLGCKILRWIPGCLEIMLCTIFELVKYILKLVYRFSISSYYDTFKLFPHEFVVWLTPLDIGAKYFSICNSH